MKKALLILLILLFAFPAFSEEIPVWESAMPLLEAIASCEYIESFKTEPSAAFANEAILRLTPRLATPSEPYLAEDVYKMIFAFGEYAPCEEEIAPAALEPVCVTIESEVDSGIGAMIVSLKVEKDYGYGFELFCYMDVHLLPDPAAPFGARVTRVFIPE